MTARVYPPQASPAAIAIHEARRQTFRQRMKTAARLLRTHPKSFRLRNRRWATILLVNGLFGLGWHLDWEMLQGTFATSRLFGVPLSDPFAALQLFIASRSVPEQILLGALVVMGFYLVVGGRAFCSWVCPYSLLAEWVERIHLHLRKTRRIHDHSFPVTTRYGMTVIFLLLSALTGYAVFETINPMAILNRAVIYGPSLALVWVVGLLAFEAFYSRRGWCRYLCPLGVMFRLLGACSLLKVQYNLGTCHHDGACRQVCPAPDALEVTKAGHAPQLLNRLSGNCTSCGRCVEVCPTNSLNFVFVPFAPGADDGEIRPPP
ncbi:MAG: NapH/MauN family ferredoxin-type protein [Magnetococcales bacterium]|nr:NapH/MauN family ferredoxin-type protein [Magnetococcales bacterium]